MASAEGTDYNQWLSELDKYAASSAQPGGGPAGLQGLNASSSGVPHKGRLNAVEQLEQEMKLLHWHKLANEAALKAALIRTKRLRQKDRRVSHKPMSAEKAAWMQRVVEEEQMKPLEVTDDFIRQYEEQERKESEKLESEVERHIKNLQQLKDNLQKREEQTRRHAVFRKKKKMLEETPIVVGDSQPAGDGTAGPRGALDLEVSEVQAGETVATSLNKLVELEQRIAQLELNDGPPSGRRQTPGSRMSARSARSGGSSMGGTTLVFRKKRTATRLDAPAKTVFSVQMVDKRTAAQQRQQTRRLSAGSRKLQARARARQQRQARERVRNQRQGAIINNWMSERKTKQAARRRRNQQRLVASKARAAAARRQLHNSSAAAGAPARGAPGAGAARRSRRGASDAAERRARGARARRAQQQQHAGRGRRAARGPAAGARQQFRDVRRQFEAAKDNARRDLAATRSGYNSNARGRRRQGAGGGGASSGRWATRRGQGTRRRNGGLDASRASGQSFRFSTRGGGGRAQRQQQQHQVGSRLGGASRRARTVRWGLVVAHAGSVCVCVVCLVMCCAVFFLCCLVVVWLLLLLLLLLLLRSRCCVVGGLHTVVVAVWFACWRLLAWPAFLTCCVVPVCFLGRCVVASSKWCNGVGVDPPIASVCTRQR